MVPRGPLIKGQELNKETHNRWFGTVHSFYIIVRDAHWRRRERSLFHHSFGDPIFIRHTA